MRKTRSRWAFNAAVLLANVLALPFVAASADEISDQRAAGTGTGFSAERLERIRPMLQRYVDEGRIAGIVTMVLRDGAVVQQAAIGWADKEARKPMREDTLVSNRFANEGAHECRGIAAH